MFTHRHEPTPWSVSMKNARKEKNLSMAWRPYTEISVNPPGEQSLEYFWDIFIILQPLLFIWQIVCLEGTGNVGRVREMTWGKGPGPDSNPGLSSEVSAYSRASEQVSPTVGPHMDWRTHEEPRQWNPLSISRDSIYPTTFPNLQSISCPPQAERNKTNDK